SVDRRAHVSERGAVCVSQSVTRTLEGHRHPEEILLLSCVLPGETARRFLLTPG
ncbi:hypothetical protein M9458_028712, partial [Cirrhinus mrigala]